MGVVSLTGYNKVKIVIKWLNKTSENFGKSKKNIKMLTWRRINSFKKFMFQTFNELVKWICDYLIAVFFQKKLFKIILFEHFPFIFSSVFIKKNVYLFLNSLDFLYCCIRHVVTLARIYIARLKTKSHGENSPLHNKHNTHFREPEWEAENSRSITSLWRDVKAPSFFSSCLNILREFVNIIWTILISLGKFSFPHWISCSFHDNGFAN